MGPKKKEQKDEKVSEKTKSNSFKQSLFITKEISKLKRLTNDRNCFSLIFGSEQREHVKGQRGENTSAPELPLVEPKVQWPPLDIFEPDYNCEVPRITIWEPFTREFIHECKILNEQDIIKHIEEILPDCLLDKLFMTTMIYTVYKWAKKNEWNDKKMSSLLGMFFNTHNYFLGSTRRNQKKTYEFFKESILLHTIDEPPKSVYILKPTECKDGLLYFCHMYLPLLPLLRVQILPNYRLKLLFFEETKSELPSTELSKKEQHLKKKSLH